MGKKKHERTFLNSHQFKYKQLVWLFIHQLYKTALKLHRKSEKSPYPTLEILAKVSQRYHVDWISQELKSVCSALCDLSLETAQRTESPAPSNHTLNFVTNIWHSVMEKKKKKISDIIYLC